MGWLWKDLCFVIGVSLMVMVVMVSLFVACCC